MLCKKLVGNMLIIFALHATPLFTTIKFMRYANDAASSCKFLQTSASFCKILFYLMTAFILH